MREIFRAILVLAWVMTSSLAFTGCGSDAPVVDPNTVEKTPPTAIVDEPPSTDEK